MSVPKVADLARDLTEAKAKYNIPRMLEILDNLDKCDIKTETLRSTQIGKIVGRVKKAASNRQIIQKSADLITKWKAVVSAEKAAMQAAKSSKSSNSTSNSETKSNGNNSNSSNSKSNNSQSKSKSKSKNKSSSSNGSNSSKSNESHASDGSDANGSGGEEKDYLESQIVTSRPDFAWETGESIRNKVISKLMSVLKPEVDYRFYSHYAEVASLIEKEMRRSIPSDKDYRAKFRDLVGNIKQNSDLKETILRGDLKISELIKMDSAQLASKELQEQRKSTKDWILQEARSDNKQNAQMTDEYKCGKCKSRKIKYSQAQTRSADEPMTTFFSCISCGNRWKQ